MAASRPPSRSTSGVAPGRSSEGRLRWSAACCGSSCHPRGRRRSPGPGSHPPIAIREQCRLVLVAVLDQRRREHAGEQRMLPLPQLAALPPLSAIHASPNIGRSRPATRRQRHAMGRSRRYGPTATRWLSAPPSSSLTQCPTGRIGGRHSVNWPSPLTRAFGRDEAESLAQFEPRPVGVRAVQLGRMDRYRLTFGSESEGGRPPRRPRQPRRTLWSASVASRSRRRRRRRHRRLVELEVRELENPLGSRHASPTYRPADPGWSSRTPCAAAVCAEVTPMDRSPATSARSRRQLVRTATTSNSPAQPHTARDAIPPLDCSRAVLLR